MIQEQLNIIEDIEFIENSNMFVNEKKYYLNMIEILAKVGYYKNRTTLKEIWKSKK